MKELKVKRRDIQGLRGLAIIGVVLSHYFPDVFPAAYLSIDIFFVIAGFLMAQSLCDSDSIFTSLKRFYSRKMRRILPLYLLIIYCISVIILLFAPRSIIVSNISGLLSSLLFCSNIQDTDAMDESAQPYLAHTWSLSLGCQYFLLAPTLFCIFTKISPTITGIIVFVTCLFSLQYQWFSEGNIASYSVFARSWQFCLGFLAYRLTQVHIEDVPTLPVTKAYLYSREYSALEITDEELHEEEQYLLSGVVIGLAFLIGFDHGMNEENILRPVVTILTAFILLRGSVVQSIVLTNSLIVYLGDISYSLYLINWPIYVFIESYFTDAILAKILGVFVSFIIAIALMESYEKWCADASSLIIGILLTVLLAINIVVIAATVSKTSHFALKNEHGHAFVNSTPKYITEIISHSQVKALIIGKFEENLNELVLENCRHSIGQLSQYNCDSFADDGCDEERLLSILERDPPDLLFLITSNSLELANNDTYDKVNRVVDMSTSIVRDRITVIHSNPMSYYKKNKKINVIANKELVDRRVQMMAEKYPGTFFVDIQALLTNFYMSNDDLSFQKEVVLWPHGIKAINSIVQDICKLEKKK